MTTTALRALLFMAAVDRERKIFPETQIAVAGLRGFLPLLPALLAVGVRLLGKH